MSKLDNNLFIIIIIFICTYSTRKEHKIEGNVYVQRLCRESIKNFHETHCVIQLRHKWSMISPMSGVSSSTKSCPSRTIHNSWIKAALCPNSSSPRQSHFTASSKLAVERIVISGITGHFYVVAGYRSWSIRCCCKHIFNNVIFTAQGIVIMLSKPLRQHMSTNTGHMRQYI